eukprot:CAMPEP_0116905254 /NCGR_PEP_ID=MMETSP0467-20121206/11880_1 /TAXON_ID=283647 /ORGANISM="Mesodinium pulex, Strain SPMC105" /LENGTH=58 /DNA_ID=CAMNT_0004580005 /DNA_START=1017 /DNA_END=1193 /DNA_ORIENTATION=+
MNSSLSVHNNHKKIMSDEFKRAFDLMSKARTDAPESDLTDMYKQIFENFNFIKENKYT